MSSKDKRRYPRVRAKNVSAHLNVADQSSPCVIQDISAGGIFIETPEALPVGMPVAVNLARPGLARALRLSGRVVWAMATRTAAKKGTRPGMRIKFDALAEGNAAELMSLLTDLGAVDSPPPLMADGAAKPVSRPVSLSQLQAQVSKLEVPAYRPSAPGATDSPRLVAQVQGLLQQLGELQSQLELKEKDLTGLRERLKVKEEALDKSDRERKAAELALQRLAMQLAARR